MFTERLARWLARSSAKSGINRPEDLNAVLSTDIGLVRAENQDLIAAIRVNTPSNVGNPFFAMALLDGMGGMQDGKQCATIALSNLFYSLIKFREGANKRGNSSRLTQSFHFFMFEPIFSPVNALNQPI